MKESTTQIVVEKSLSDHRFQGVSQFADKILLFFPGDFLQKNFTLITHIWYNVF